MKKNYKNNKKKNQVFTLLEDRLFRASALVLLTCLMCVPKKRKNITGHASPSVFVFCRQEIYLKVKIASISHLTFLWGESALKKVNGLFQPKNRRNIQKKRLYNGEAIDIWDLLTLFGI